MRKITVAFEAPHFPEGAMRFIKEMNDAEQVIVTGVFLPGPVQTAYPTPAAMSAGMLLPLTDEITSKQLNKSILTFKDFCTSHHIGYRFIKNTGDSGWPELKKQSRYADLIVLGSDVLFDVPGKDKLSDYLKTSLHEVECPVVIVPDNFSSPQHTIITFDGTESSARAIKNFAYLFPEMAHNHTRVITFTSKNNVSNESDARIRELVSVHFPDHKFIHSDVDSGRYFSNWNINNKPAIVVCGAFGRSMMSVLFKHSFIAEVLSDRKLPVFISHT